MKLGIFVLFGAAYAVCSAQTTEVRPQVAGRTVQEGQVTTVYVAPRFATAIRMPDAINSVVLGDPEAFSAEHSDKEPQIVFVKPVTTKPAQTNLLISTARGHQANILLISRGQADGLHPDIDFLMRYRPAGRFLIEPTAPTTSIAQTAQLSTHNEKPTEAVTGPTSGKEHGSSGTGSVPIAPASFRDEVDSELSAPRGSSSDLERLLERQRKAPLPVLYGEKPGIAPPGKQILKTGASEVIDQGKQVVVLFSVLNVQDHAVELMPPRVQLAGKVTEGAIVHHKVWSNSEQLPVEDFRLSRRRLGPGERADGVVVFDRPGFKQSNETLLLQMADSGAVDRPALAPIGFGINLRKKGGE
jgi:hypothetical protein